MFQMVVVWGFLSAINVRSSTSRAMEMDEIKEIGQDPYVPKMPGSKSQQVKSRGRFTVDDHIAMSEPSFIHQDEMTC
jgi:hypothetical protein